MTDPGWMVDDGTCDQCLEQQCWLCPDAHEEGSDGELLEVCCCNEQYIVSREPILGGKA